MRGRHNDLDIFYLSQSYFGSPKRSIRNISNKKILFIQTLKGIENIYRDVAGYDMNYDEFKQICRKPWEDEYNSFCIDRSKKRDQRRFCNCKESKNTYIERTHQPKAFRLTKMLFAKQKQRRFRRAGFTTKSSRRSTVTRKDW